MLWQIYKGGCYIAPQAHYAQVEGCFREDMVNISGYALNYFLELGKVDHQLQGHFEKTKGHFPAPMFVDSELQLQHQEIQFPFWTPCSPILICKNTPFTHTEKKLN